MVTSMKLNERPKSGGSQKGSKKKPLDDEAEGSFDIYAKKQTNSKPNSRRDSLINNLVKQRTLDVDENEMFINLAAEIDEKFYLNQASSAPKVEIFVKRLSAQNADEEEHSIYLDDDEDFADYENVDDD